MMPRLINGNQIRKNCFCLSATALSLASVILTLYSWSIEAQYKNMVLASSLEVKMAQIERMVKFDNLWIDSTGKYFIYRNTYHKKAVKDQLTIITHCPLRYISYLPLLLKNWDGPVSIALFVDSLDDFVFILKAFTICNYNDSQRISYHVVQPVDHGDLKSSRLSKDIDFPLLYDDPVTFCSKFEKLVMNLYQKSDDDLYPGNFLRNVAYDGAITNFVLHLDINMMPSKNLSELFNQFVSESASSLKSLETTALVLPTFEIQYSYFYSNVHPSFIDKASLLTLLKENIAQPLFSVNGVSQNYTNYNKWLTLEQKRNLEPAYEVTWAPDYEPIFISMRKTTPLHNEKFKGFSFDRLSLLCELHMAGWTFKVLDLPFVYKIGGSANYEPKQRNTNRNWRLYWEFRNQLMARYSNNNRTCDNPPIYQV